LGWPYGGALQWSLFNQSGNTADAGACYQDRGSNRFVAPDMPGLSRLFECFASRLINFRLNGILPGSGLSPHEEAILRGEQVFCRFHLPVFTNPRCRILLDNELFEYREGFVYFFNKGCVHGASNDSDHPRYHLVWDLWLDPWVMENVLDLEQSSTPGEGSRKLALAESAELTRGTPVDVSEDITGMPGGEVLVIRRVLFPRTAELRSARIGIPWKSMVASDSDG
jgi:hypothetical protein